MAAAPSRCLSPVFRIVADQRLPTAGAALVEQHDVVIAVDACKRAGVAHVQIAWPPGPDRRPAETAARRRARRLSAGTTATCRSMVAAGRLRGVLRHLQDAAARGDRGDLQRMLEAAFVQARNAAGVGRRPPAASQQKRRKSAPTTPVQASSPHCSSVAIRYPRPPATW